MNDRKRFTTGYPTWHSDDGAPVSCHERIKVMNENLAEIRQMAQDAFEVALLMGCSEAQVREVCVAVMRGLYTCTTRTRPRVPDALPRRAEGATLPYPDVCTPGGGRSVRQGRLIRGSST